MRLKLSIVLVLVALALSGQADEYRIMKGDVAPEDRICFALYTIHENTLKLTAQFYPIKGYEPFEARLEIKNDEEWTTVDEADIIYPGYTAEFRVEDWDDSREREYRVVHNEKAFYEGLLRKNPRDKEEIIVCIFTGNSIAPSHGGDISKQDIVENLKKIQPDVLFFSGDQVYNHSEHLLHWLKFGRDFGEIIGSTPTISIPDDHDVGQGNIWGEGGVKATTRDGSMGGYYMPVEYVKEVERAQTSHLPDPYDPTPIERGIGVYYTDLKWGGISFAIIEDRKFKTGWQGRIDRRKMREPGFDTRDFDVPEARLLGERQLEFLEAWTTDWEDAEMKAVLSQTLFTQSSNYSGKHTREIKTDFDSNGWPQSGRNKALSVIRKSYSCMLAGDQHLGSVIHHGIDEWNDAGYSFCTPSIANFWLRWWTPSEPGLNRKKGAPDYTGEFLDGFKNKITVHAVANPTLPEIEEGGKLSTRAAGFGIARFNKQSREITFECWGRNIDITDPESKQYPGWPVTIAQAENFPMENGFKLPRLELSKADQVVTIKDSKSGETVSSLRIKGHQYQPKVPGPGSYTIIAGEGEEQKIYPDTEAQKKNRKVLELEL